MATTASLEVEATIDPANMNLEQLVSDATWKDILIDLARKHKFDPWNVDIVEVVDKYIEAIKSMKVMDLRIPANIILAAAILLRLKSEMLDFSEQEVDEETGEPRPIISVEQLSFRLRIPPKRKITLAELITALEEAMKLKEIRETSSNKSALPININIKALDIEAEIENVYTQVKGKVDKSNMVTFSNLASGRELEDALLGLFIPLLFLSHKRRVTLIQEAFFDEIIIALN